MRNHTRVVLLALALALALASAGCGGETGNPFAALSQTETPGAGTDLVFLSNLHQPGAPLSEVFALDADAAGEPQRLTFCNEGAGPCETLQASPNPDRIRLAVRRIRGDANRDGRLDADDGVSLEVIDLGRGLETEFVTANARVSGVDWSPTADLLVYSGRNPAPSGGNGDDDLFRISGTRQDNVNLTMSGQFLERNPRVDPQGQLALYERSVPIRPPDAVPGAALTDPSGVSEIWLFQNSLAQAALTTAPPAGARLPRTAYYVGSDADPSWSPDGQRAVFRRLTAIGAGRGSWELRIVTIQEQLEQRVVASGPLYRSAPDWGPRGILYSENDLTSNRLLLLDPDTGAVEVLLAAPAQVRIEAPRWLAPPRPAS